jgi:hypothetical protein
MMVDISEQELSKAHAKVLQLVPEANRVALMVRCPLYHDRLAPPNKAIAIPADITILALRRAQGSKRGSGRACRRRLGRC